MEEVFTNKIIDSSLLNSSSKEPRTSQGFELFKSLLGPLESANNEKKHNNYYENNTILNLEENLTRSTIETEERATFLYKVIMKMIEKHLNDKQHPLNHLLNFYIDYFIKKVENERCCKEIYTEEEIQTLIDDVKSFMNILRNSIYIFYNFSELSFKIKKTFHVLINLFTFDNLTNFFTSYFFYKFEIYDVLFDLHCKTSSENEVLLQKNLKILKTWSPTDFGVSDAFTLDFLTYKYLQKNHKIKLPFNKILKKPKKDLENKETATKEEKEESKGSEKNGVQTIQDYKNKSTFGKSEKIEKTEEDETVEYLPYEKAIEKLNMLVPLKSPLQQLKILNETFENIIDSISEFYLKFNVLFDKYLESDDLISIVIYIISQSNLPHLTSHIKIMDNFITQNYLLNIIGYQFVTLKACLNYIENISEIEYRKDQKYSVSALKESILIDLKKENNSHLERKTFII